MSIFKDKRKALVYWPLSLGALAFAAVGVLNIVQTQSDTAVSAAANGDNAEPQVQSLQPNGGDCSPQSCAACGYCASSQLTEIAQPQPETLTDNLEIY